MGLHLQYLEGDLTVSDDETPANYAERVGERLRAVRKQKHLSLQAVEAGSDQEFKASVLGAYERGERAISVPRLQRLAKYYNVPVDQLLPRDAGPDCGGRDSDDADEAIDLRGDDPRSDRMIIDLTRLEDLEADERELLSRYLGMIQLQRQDFNGRMLTIRQEDLVAIGCLFESTAERMRRRLDDLGLRLHV